MGDAARRKKLGLTTLSHSAPAIYTGIVWHYTVGDCFHEIIKTGVIIQSGLGVLKRIRPVAWFSKDQFWEPTATKKHPQNPKISLPTWQDNARFYNGVYRIGADLSKTPMLSWGQTPQRILLTAQGTKNLEDDGRALGANPNDWYACLNAVHREEWVAIQVLEEGKWENIVPDERRNEMDVNLAAAALIQRIIKGPATLSAIRMTLSESTSDLRNEAITQFRTNSTLRSLFPEFAELFDKEDFTVVN